MDQPSNQQGQQGQLPLTPAANGAGATADAVIAQLRQRNARLEAFNFALIVRCRDMYRDFQEAQRQQDGLLRAQDYLLNALHELAVEFRRHGLAIEALGDAWLDGEEETQFWFERCEVMETECEEMETECGEMETRLEEMEEKLSREEEASNAALEQLAVARGEITVLQAEVSRQQAETAALREKSVKLECETVAKDRLLNTISTERDMLRAELDQANADRDAMSAKLDSANLLVAAQAFLLAQDIQVVQQAQQINNAALAGTNHERMRSNPDTDVLPVE